MAALAAISRSIFDGDHEIFRDAVHRFLQKEAVPYHYPQWENDGQVSRELWTRAGDAGFLCPTVAPEYGGAGTDFRFSTVIIEEIAYLGLSGIGIPLHNDIVAPYVEHYGSEELKLKYLPKMASGEMISAIAMTEPGTGSDLQGVKTTAILNGDHYVLNGSKTFITNGQLADLVIVVAKTEPGEGSKGISLFLVESAWEGFTKGKNLEKVGMKAQDTSELFFQDVKIPKENLLGKDGQGFIYLMQELPQERLLVGVSAIAAAEAGYKWTVDYCKERKAFGRAISSFQNTRFKLAEIKADIMAGRAFVDRCVDLHLEKKLDVPTAAALKLWTTELQCRVFDECVQLHGGYGYMREYPIARGWADSRVQKIYAGTNEIMKEIISRSL